MNNARPILMSAPMVRALLADRKTQTRRSMKPQPWTDDLGRLMWGPCHGFEGIGWAQPGSRVHSGWFSACPHGQPGDLLYVRETWRTLQKVDCLKPSQLADDPSKITFDADPENRNKLWAFGKTRSGIHMPHWASRLTLKVTDLRIERLQDISEDDAIAEGLRYRDAIEAWTASDDDFWPCFSDPRRAYSGLWAHINGNESWLANPWVWCISFETLRENVDSVLEREAA